jgi:hypothetical protein
MSSVDMAAGRSVSGTSQSLIDMNVGGAGSHPPGASYGTGQVNIVQLLHGADRFELGRSVLPVC